MPHFNPLSHSNIFHKPRRLTDVPSWHQHIPFAFAAMSLLRPAVFVELGVHKGDSYCTFCQAVEELALRTQCSAIDSWAGDEHAGAYEQDVLGELRGYHDPLYGSFSRLIQSTFDEAVSQFADHSIDLLHIDGLHTYEAVKRDFESWLPKMSSRGVVMFHDTQVRERDFGVWRLWEEVSARYPAREFKFEHGLGVAAVGRDCPPEFLALLRLADTDWALVEQLFAVLGRQIAAHGKDAEIDRAFESRNALLASLRNELATRETQIESLGPQISELKAVIGERDREKASLIAGKHDLERALADLERENGELKSALGEQEERAATVHIELTDLVAQTVMLRHDITGRDAHITSMSAALSAHQDQVEAARQSLAALHASTSWRLTAPLRRLKSLPSLKRTKPLVLKPVAQLRKESEVGLTTKWAMTGEDPNFLLEIPGGAPLPPGHYALIFEFPAGWTHLVQPVIYFDSGSGFSQSTCVHLRLVPRGARRSIAYFVLPTGASELRFDPSSAPGTLEIGRVWLQRVSRSRFYATLARRFAGRHFTSPRTAVVNMVKVAKALAGGRLHELAAKLRREDARATTSNMQVAGEQVDYQQWIEFNDALTDEDLVRMRQLAQGFADPVLISMLMPVYNTPEHLLREVIDSVLAQTYEKWELCIADDCSVAPHVKQVLQEYAAKDTRIKVTYRAKNGHISLASNSALERVTGSWVALLDHDDLLTPHALFCVAEAINRHPGAQIIYSDEDRLDQDGSRRDPHFKCDWNYDLFTSQNYLNHLTVCRSDLIRNVGGWRVGYEGSQDYDLLLRIIETIDHTQIIHIPHILYHWRAVEGSTALSGAEKTYAFDAGMNALRDHIERAGIKASVEKTPRFAFYRLKRKFPEPAPLVTLIIPTRNQKAVLELCVSSILAKTTYPNFELLIVDNGSDEPDACDYLAALSKAGRATVLQYPGPFNFSAINNFAVSEAQGSIVGLINNDIEVINGDWLDEMVSQVSRPEIGCVGGKLYYPNDTLQHAGVILGLGGIAGHSHKHFPRDAKGYVFRPHLVQGISAVTAACLLVRKEVYCEVGGLDAEALKVAFNDVDFCLKVHQAGYRNLWTPYAELYHHESLSRGQETTPEKQARFAAEIVALQTRWSAELEDDSAYSPNLSLATEDFALARESRAPKSWRAGAEGRPASGPRLRIALARK